MEIPTVVNIIASVLLLIGLVGICVVVAREVRWVWHRGVHTGASPTSWDEWENGRCTVVRAGEELHAVLTCVR